jgi:hypothetical protein
VRKCACWLCQTLCLPVWQPVGYVKLCACWNGSPILFHSVCPRIKNVEAERSFKKFHIGEFLIKFAEYLKVTNRSFYRAFGNTQSDVIHTVCDVKTSQELQALSNHSRAFSFFV